MLPVTSPMGVDVPAACLCLVEVPTYWHACKCIVPNQMIKSNEIIPYVQL